MCTSCEVRRQGGSCRADRMAKPRITLNASNKMRNLHHHGRARRDTGTTAPNGRYGRRRPFLVYGQAPSRPPGSQRLKMLREMRDSGGWYDVTSLSGQAPEADPP